MADATTRLILIAIVAGGLLTVILNISRLRSLHDSDEPSNQPDDVAPVEDLLREGFPVQQAVVRGDEDAARAAVVEVGQKMMPDAAHRVAGMQKRNGAAPAKPAEPFESALELARGADGSWRILQMRDLKPMIIGVVHAGPEPTIVFWGGYDVTGPGEWSTWTMLLPLPEK